MRITIKGKEVTLEDESGHIAYMSTDQLLEMLRTLNAATNQDGGLIFDMLELTV